MADSIKILVFDEDESLLDAIANGPAYPTGLDVRKVTHINDLILALDEFEPHIVVVNERLSSYESLSVLAIAKKRGQEIPYMVFFDDNQKIRTIKRHPSSENLPHFGEIVPAIEDILMNMSRKRDTSENPFHGSPFKDIFERFAVFSDYSFLLSQEHIILMYAKKAHVPAPAPDEEFRGCHFEDVLSLFFDKKKLLKLQLELITKLTFELELWNGKDDRKAFYAVRGITLPDGLKFIGLQDLTLLKAAEDVSLSQNRILESLPLGIILLDFDEQIVFTNLFVRNLFSIEGDLTGKTFDDVIPVKFTDTSLLQMKKLLYEEGNWKGKVYYRDQQHHKKGLSMRAFLQRSIADQVTGILLFLDTAGSDVMFNEWAADYRSIVEQIPEGIFILEDDTLVYANDLFCKMLGYVEQDQLIGIRFPNLLEGSDVDPYSGAVAQIKSYEETSRELDMRFSHKNGINRIYAHVTFNLMQNPSTLTIIGTVRDITEKKLMEKALPFRSESEFSSDDPKRGNEHDFRTYLNAILGFADILKEQSKGFADQSMSIYTDHIFASGRKLLQLMEETAVLVDTPVVPTGQRRESIDVTAMANEALEKYRDKAGEKNLRLTVASTSEIFVIADRRFLLDALQRIIANCILCSPSGTVLVDCGYDAIKHNVFIRIKDNRLPIPEDLLNELFDPIIDMAGPLNEQFRETNIMFSVVKRILENMDGKIEVQSSAMTGTIIYIQLPMDEEKTGTTGAGQNVYYTISPDVIYLNDLRPYILIIEDDPGSSKMLEITLRNVAKLEIAANGDDALSIIGQRFEQGILFDIVLIDIGLPPPWNGITLSHHIKSAFQGYQQVSFIAETAFALRNDREKILASGFSGFLSKPIDRRYLIKTIASVIRKKRGDEEPKYESYTD
jgi:PAS domain S-box-containing protein